MKNQKKDKKSKAELKNGILLGPGKEYANGGYSEGDFFGWKQHGKGVLIFKDGGFLN